MRRLNKSEQRVIDIIELHRHFTHDYGHGIRVNNAAYKLVCKGVCKFIESPLPGRMCVVLNTSATGVSDVSKEVK